MYINEACFCKIWLIIIVHMCLQTSHIFYPGWFRNPDEEYTVAAGYKTVHIIYKVILQAEHWPVIQGWQYEVQKCKLLTRVLYDLFQITNSNIIWWRLLLLVWING